MALARLRQRFALPDTLDDREVMRQAFARGNEERTRAGKPAYSREEFQGRVTQLEGAGATAAPQATRTPTAAAPEGKRAAPPTIGGDRVSSMSLSDLVTGKRPPEPMTPLRAAQGVGNFVGGAVKEFGKDVAGLGMGLTVDPIAQMGRAVQQRKLIVEPTPEEADRAKRGLALLAGTVAGGVAGKAIPAGATALRGLLKASGVGGAAGGADAAVRSGGNLRETAGGVVAGGVLGPILHGAAKGVGKLLPKRAPTPTESGAALDGPSKKAKNPARSVGGRLQELGGEGQEILRRVKEADTLALTEAGPVKRRLKGAGLPKLTREEDRLVGRSLRGSEGELTPRAEAVRGEARGYLGGVVPRAKEAGLTTGDLGESYFPQNIPDVGKMKAGGTLARLIAGARQKLGDKNASANPVRDDIVDNLVHLGKATDDTQAAAQLDDYIRYIETGGKEGGDEFARAIGGDPEIVKGQALARYMETRGEKNPNLDFSRSMDIPFYDPSPSRVLPRYIEGAERRIAEAGQYGPKGEKIRRLLEGIPDSDQRGRTAKMAKVATGLVEEQDDDLARWSEMARRYSATRLSPASTVLNLSQNVNSFYASDVPSFVKGVMRSATKGGEDLAIDSGAISESAMANVRHAIRPGSDFVEKYLKMIGFSGVEKLNRRIAANVGWTYAQKMTKKLLRDPGSRFARKELAALELDADAILKQGGLNERDLIRAAKVFVDRTQFRQREIDLPSAFTSSAIGRNLTQFKGFSYQQGQFLTKEILDQWRSGTPEGKRRAVRNLTTLLAAAPVLGEGVGNARAFLLGNERDKEGMERYLENLGYAGGLGILMDVVQSSELGEKGLLGFAAGPSVGTAAGVLASGITAGKRFVEEGEGPTPGEQRRVIRALPGGAVIANRVAPSE